MHFTHEMGCEPGTIDEESNALKGKAIGLASNWQLYVGAVTIPYTTS